MKHALLGIVVFGALICTGCHPTFPATPSAKAMAPLISLSVAASEHNCEPEGTLVVAIHNPGTNALWMRIAQDEEDDAYRRFWLHVVARDGRTINSRCIPSSHTQPYEVLGAGATVKFELGALSCYRQSTPGWYLVTVHYQDDPPPVEAPAGDEAAYARVTAALRGPDAPPGASKVRSRVDSNGQWIFLKAAGSVECQND